MARPATSKTRIWLLPFCILGGVCLTIFVLTSMVDGAVSDDPLHVLSLILRPNPEAAANTLANAGEIVAAVLAIALTVVAIIVELASNRYTHRVTELFVSEPINFTVMGLFVVTALQGMWTTMTFDHEPGSGGFVPYAGIAVTMGLLTLCLLILLPYFNFVFAYLNPIQIVARIQRHSLRVVARTKDDVVARQSEAARGVEQLSDIALNAMQNRDKGVSMAALDALCGLLRDYQRVREGLSDAWFSIGERLSHNPDFVSMDGHVLEEIGARRIWFEMKILRQYQTVYGAALNRMRDLNYLIAINTRLIAQEAVRSERIEVLHLAMKFFNTYLRAAINNRDVRTAYNVFHQYRLLAQTVLGFRQGSYAVEIARYFKYYGQLAYTARLPFVLEIVAYDLCSLTELAHRRGAAVEQELLRILLSVDKESEGEIQEASLRGVRKAQVKLATYYLERGDQAAARKVHEDMAQEDPARLASIRDELVGVQSQDYWEIVDRGVNFDYLGPSRKVALERFFAWFPALPRAGGTRESEIPAVPGSEAPSTQEP